MATLEELERQAQAASRRRVLTVVIALLAVGTTASVAWWLFPDAIGAAVASVSGRIPPARAREARALVDAAEARARGLQQQRQGAFADVIAGRLVPRPDLGACPLAIAPGSDAELLERSRAYDAMHAHVGASPHAFRLETTAHTVRERLYEDVDARLLDSDLEVLRALDGPAHDFTLVLGVAEHGAVAGDTFEGGRYAGTLYVYDAATASVPCAARFDVASSAVVTSVHGGSAAMDAISDAMAVQADLQANATRAALAALVRTGAPP